MRRLTLKKRVVVQGLIAAIAAQAGIAFADAPPIVFSGYLQSSYVANLNSPHDGTSGAGTGAKLANVGRQFDTDSNGFSFNTFLLQVAKPVGDDHYGFTTRLRTGQDAAAIVGGAGSFAVQEAYLTYAATSKLSIIGGKFVTPEGFEVVDTVSNPNFSEGLLFTFAEPITHTGLKANYVFSDMMNATLGVVNGWDTTGPDNNDAKTIVWQVVTTPVKSLVWYVQGLYGKELADPTNSSRLSLDTVLTYTMGKWSVAGQGNWGQQSNDPGVITNGGTAAGTSHWVGAGVWLSFAETAKCTTSLRFEVLNDENFANRFGAGTFATTGETNQTVKEVTITQKHMLTTAMGVRAEFRHDWSNEAYFRGHEGGAVRNQNTVSADWFVTF